MLTDDGNGLTVSHMTYDSNVDKDLFHSSRDVDIEYISVESNNEFVENPDRT